MIAWAVGGVVGALPAGVIGTRIGRRNAMLLGFASDGCALFALDRVDDHRQATPLIALASARWTLPTVSAYPLFVEPVPAAAPRRACGAVSAVHGAWRRIRRSAQRRLFDLAAAIGRSS